MAKNKLVAIVTGGAGGLGSLIASHLSVYDYDVHKWDVHGGAGKWDHVDVTSMVSVLSASSKLDRVDVLVNCAGFNRITPIEAMTADVFNQHMAVNARGILYTVQTLLMKMHSGVVCNVISNASHMPMRMSLAYNASKAAAEMMTRQMARELGVPHDLTVFGVSPNRLAGTPMSQDVDRQVSIARGWSFAETRRRQLEALPIGEETDPAAVAEFIAFLLSTKSRHKYLHGTILEYGI